MYKLIIADDEEIECRTLEQKIRNFNLNLEILPSVNDGISLIQCVSQEHPDIVIADINMPEMNGLESIELLQMKQIDLAIIINSAYSDFSYMQKALQLGAIDYLLKPSSRGALKDAICKAIDVLNRKKNEEQAHNRAQAIANRFYDVTGEKWLLSLILREEDETCYQWLLENNPEVEYGCVFVAWKLLSADGVIIRNIGKYSQDILQSCRNICNCVGVEYKGIFFICLMPGIQLKDEDYRPWAVSAVTYGANRLKQNRVESVIAVSRYKTKKDQFISGIQEVQFQLQSKDIPGIVFFRSHIEKKESRTLSDLAALCSRLLTKDEPEECVKTIRQVISDQMTGIADEPDVLNEWKVKVAMFFEETEHNLKLIQNQSEIKQKYWPLWNKFTEIHSTADLMDWIEQGILSCYQSFRRERIQTNGYVEQALIYIYENYTQDISLEQAAQATGISPTYLSHLFKQENGLSFIEVLTDIRIRRAIQMMREKQNSIRDISYAVGYLNPSYFYKVFKKTTGLTVGEFRRYL